MESRSTKLRLTEKAPCYWRDCEGAERLQY